VAATQLDTAASVDQGVTAPTIAFTDAAAVDTVAVTPAVTPLVDEADGIDATRVLPAADRSFFATPAAARPDAAPTRSELRAQSRASHHGERRWVRPLIAIALLLVVLGVAAWIVIGALSAPSTAPEPEPLPAVPGDLGVHLEQLDEAVTGGG
jgi:eukaryotic-like serine/threonine-protein kinase